ncbi:MAG TPA: M48 family metallopeptidase [Dokdonella sp.]|uniref:M48 family metallopeptidase n=1 Tax=Dokdonella sp. TaxID=2291710 RepID=UPI0025B7AB8C|nr:M48 family metallopeptidase [Dokdonella sp.]MBX3690646.1 M48 family metallopeptidase [Dokdonella sp.]HNR91428.1 M48 family metallopeptidase [Dokdonella sp.]
MNTFSAHWFDGVTSRMHEVMVSRDAAGVVHVAGDGVERSAALAGLRITPRLGRTPRTIAFDDGARLLVADHPLLDAWFPSEDRLQRLVDRLERHAHAVAASIVVCVAALVVAVVWGIPWAADRIAEQVPMSVEDRLGDGVLAQLDDHFGFGPSGLESAREAELRARFERVVAAAATVRAHRLEFRHSDEVGANALALPGGTIVVTDDLVEAMSDDRAFDAIIAHELGHQQHRHALRQTLRSSFVIVLGAFFAGDVSAASSVVIGVPTFLLQNHYSRGFEEESDRYAFATLEAMGESPAWFAEGMRNLQQAHEDYGDAAAWLSTHPSDEARIAAAEAAGEAFLERHPDRFRDVPGYDPCADEDICEDEEPEEDCGEDDCADAESDPLP